MTRPSKTQEWSGSGPRPTASPNSTISRMDRSNPSITGRKRHQLRAVVLVSLVLVAGCHSAGNDSREVTAYVSADRPFSEPILKDYEQRSGVKVNVVYNTEETKSTGLANRLL